MCLDLRTRCLTTVGNECAELGTWGWAEQMLQMLSPTSFSCPSTVSQMDFSEWKGSEGVLDCTFR